MDGDVAFDTHVYHLARIFIEDGFKGSSPERLRVRTEELAREIQRAIEDYFEFVPDDEEV